MGRSRTAWALSVAAPWCIGLAVLVSITAEAEQEPLPGVSRFASTRMIEAAGRLDRALQAARPLRAVDEDGEPLPIVKARLVAGDPDGLAAASDEIEPNGALKSPPQPFPSVERAAKGDPFIGLRPGFDARGLNGAPALAGLDPGEPWPHELEDPRDAEFDSGHTMSPERPGDGALPPAERPGLAFDDGATPGLPLEFALNSSSPTPSDGVVVVVETDSAGESTIPQLSAADGKPNYAALIDPKDSARQMRCLAEAIYFESRSEPEDGQAAVAQVVLNRVRSGIYPTTVCGVVYQDRNRPFACQFTFACEGKSLRIEEPGPWGVATRIAADVVSGANYNPKVGEAVNYHANYVSPFWVGYLRRVDRIGAHIFYAMRDGVNWAPGALNGRGDLPPIAN
jgi:Cell Wall Hydrolase